MVCNLFIPFHHAVALILNDHTISRHADMVGNNTYADNTTHNRRTMPLYSMQV